MPRTHVSAGFMLDFVISLDAADQLHREKGARLIDVREPWEFATASIEGSLFTAMGHAATGAHMELDFG
jgi:rhodanese-related sulfurtransferase